VKTNLKQRVQALADPTRMAIFERIAGAGRSLAVVDIADGLAVSRSAVSQHLKVLKVAGLVIDQPAANRRLYRIEPQSLAELRDYFDGFWRDSLLAFKQAAETPEDSP
jgi:DNA-binding transcriptional ArsR family regulator